MKFHQFAEYLLQEVDNFSACRSVMRLTHLSRSVSLSGTCPKSDSGPKPTDSVQR